MLDEWKRKGFVPASCSYSELHHRIRGLHIFVYLSIATYHIQYKHVHTVWGEVGMKGAVCLHNSVTERGGFNSTYEFHVYTR